jgi:uncharacterized RmlC-like cupin family protein
VKKIRPVDRITQQHNHPGISREVAISSETVQSQGIYTAVVRTPPGGSTLVHHHGECETSIYVLRGRAKFTYGPTGVEHEMSADPGDIVFIPAEEVHVEANVSLTESLEVLVTRNCSEPFTEVIEES